MDDDRYRVEHGSVAVTDGTSEADDAVDQEPSAATGNPAVDQVLASLNGLDELPIADQVGVFESAHEALRGALADAGTDG